jgi:ATP-dependent DNA helicase UvrD/PcrA
LERLYDEAQSRRADLCQLESIAKGYRSRRSFLIDLTLDPPEVTTAPAGQAVTEEDYTILSTIHSAKGQEYEHVRILNVLDGCIPLARAMRTADEVEEERRLLYVAMTRAKDELDLIVPRHHYTYQQPNDRNAASWSQTSRFVPESIRHLFKMRHRHGPTRRPHRGVP